MAAEEDGWEIDGAPEVTALCVPDSAAVEAVLEKVIVNDDAEPGGGTSLTRTLELDRLPEDNLASFVEIEEDLTSSGDVRRSISRFVVALKTTSAPMAEPKETMTIANILSLKFDPFCLQGTVAAAGYAVLPRIEVSAMEHAAETSQLVSNCLRTSFVIVEELKNERIHPIFAAVRT